MKYPAGIALALLLNTAASGASFIPMDSSHKPHIPEHPQMDKIATIPRQEKGKVTSRQPW